jgi:hypothetical protein
MNGLPDVNLCRQSGILSVLPITLLSGLPKQPFYVTIFVQQMHQMYYKLSVSYSAPTCFDVYTSSPGSLLYMLKLQINKVENISGCYQELLD